MSDRYLSGAWIAGAKDSTVPSCKKAWVGERHSHDWQGLWPAKTFAESNGRYDWVLIWMRRSFEYQAMRDQKALFRHGATQSRAFYLERVRQSIRQDKSQDPCDFYRISTASMPQAKCATSESRTD